MEFKTRREMNLKFTEMMNDVYESRLEEKKQNFGQNMIKSYLVEGHVNKDLDCHEHETQKTAHDDFNRFFKENIKKLDYNLNIFDTEEEHFFKLEIEDVVFYLDAVKDQRFWMIHTPYKTEDVDKRINKFIDSFSHFDKIWLTNNLMNNTQKYTTWNSISLKHDEPSKIEEEQQEQENISFKIGRASQSKILKLMDMLDQSEDFRYSTGICRLSVKVHSKYSDRPVIDDIKYDGKFSTRGSDFNDHLWLINKIYSNYKEQVINVEDNFSLSYNKKRLEGLPINIKFSRRDLDVHFLIKYIFSGTNPFKLWGFPKELSKGYYKILGLDLHKGNLGNKINFEMTSEFIRIYLPKGNCGNTIARLISNIQRHIDSKIKVWGGDEENELF